MAKVNAYRESNGIRKLESPYVYDEPNNPGLGDYLTAKGRRIASRNAKIYSADHEGGQIGVTCGCPYNEKWTVAQIVDHCFTTWKNSPTHNANMLAKVSRENRVDVGVMHVYEYFDGAGYVYAAIMSVSTAPLNIDAE